MSHSINNSEITEKLDYSLGTEITPTLKYVINIEYKDKPFVVLVPDPPKQFVGLVDQLLYKIVRKIEKDFTSDFYSYVYEEGPDITEKQEKKAKAMALGHFTTSLLFNASRWRLYLKDEVELLNKDIKTLANFTKECLSKAEVIYDGEIIPLLEFAEENKDEEAKLTLTQAQGFYLFHFALLLLQKKNPFIQKELCTTLLSAMEYLNTMKTS